MLGVTIKSIMLNVIMLIVVKLNVVTPWLMHLIGRSLTKRPGSNVIKLFTAVIYEFS